MANFFTYKAKRDQEQRYNVASGKAEATDKILQKIADDISSKNKSEAEALEHKIRGGK